MPSSANFASAYFEPTDADLQALATEAFAGVREAEEATLQRFREQIAAARRQVLLELREKLAESASKP